MTTNNILKIYLIIGLLIVYLMIKNFVPYGDKMVYIITLIVTFMHEFGHCFFAGITGGHVQSMQINSDGSGFALTSGGIRSLVIMGGYIGSAIFGSILLYIGAKKTRYAELVLYFMSGLMIFAGLFWYHGFVHTLILFFLAGIIFFIAYKTKYDDIVLMFIGISSLSYIITDFKNGPSSDLERFSGFLPPNFWMIIWLIIVLIIIIRTFKMILKG